MSDSERSGSEGTSIKEHQYAQALAGLIMDSGEDHETSGSPTPPPRSVGIEQAIDEAPAQELKKLVRRLLDLPQARPLIDAALLRPLGNGASSSNGLKRKASEVCENCHHVYQVDTNKRGMCRYHPLEQEVDEESDFWADHDPDCHCDPLDDSLMNDPVYADGYIMGCCGKPPYELGCVVSWHKPSVNLSQELSNVEVLEPSDNLGIHHAEAGTLGGIGHAHRSVISLYMQPAGVQLIPMPMSIVIDLPENNGGYDSSSANCDYNSARETSGSPTPPPQSITVKDAINGAPAAELKSLMQRLSANVPEARTFIEAALLRPIDNAESSTNALKRKATEECKNCEEYYEVEDNKKKRCRYHPSGPELDLRSKAWDYHYYRVDGHAEDLVDDPTYKDGFIMSCCYKRPYESGCVVSRHKPKVNTVGNKRVRR